VVLTPKLFKLSESSGDYARALRAIGQDLANLLPENFEIVLEGMNYVAHGHGLNTRQHAPKDTPVNPGAKWWKRMIHHNSNTKPVSSQSSVVRFVRKYASEDIDRLNELRISQRRASGGPPDLHSLCEELRTFGRIVDSNGGKLIKVCKNKNIIKFQYRDANGDAHTEELSHLELYRIQQQYYSQRSTDPWGNWSRD